MSHFLKLTKLFINTRYITLVDLQPGKYKVVFRYDFAKETVKTIERNFEVKSGIAQTVRLL